jgi:bifunctional UDP-N-acetylglucosamine pyrophosphorylase / glucosamine-1-phosphate N-acetyltransferase
MKTVAIILAAGKGVRMRSDLPKVSHMVLGKPMIVRVLETVEALGLDDIFVVVGYKSDIVKAQCQGFNVTFVEQKEQLGTGHAAGQAAPYINNDSTVLILNGDMPLISTDTLQEFISSHKDNRSASATILTAVLPDPDSYGRIVRDNGGRVVKIVEKKDATEDELAIKEINTGTYCFNSKELFDALNQVRPDNAQKEFYLTDVIGILTGKGLPVYAHKAKDPNEVLGVNTIEERARIEELFKNAS